MEKQKYSKFNTLKSALQRKTAIVQRSIWELADFHSPSFMLKYYTGMDSFLFWGSVMWFHSFWNSSKINICRQEYTLFNFCAYCCLVILCWFMAVVAVWVCDMWWACMWRQEETLSVFLITLPFLPFFHPFLPHSLPTSISICMDVLPAYMSVCHLHAYCLLKLDDITASPEAGVTGSWKLSCRYWNRVWVLWK